MQNKADLGKRYTCFQCGAKFYDLNKPEAVCPKCGADQAEDPQPDPRVAVMSKYKASTRAVPKKKPKVDPYDGDLDDNDEELDDEEADLDDDEDDADMGDEDMGDDM